MTIDSTTTDRLTPPEPVTLAEPPSHLLVLLSPAGNDDSVDHREVPRALAGERVREPIRTAPSTTAAWGTLTEAMAA